jgi:hypothetical protein
MGPISGVFPFIKTIYNGRVISRLWSGPHMSYRQRNTPQQTTGAPWRLPSFFLDT